MQRRLGTLVPMLLLLMIIGCGGSSGQAIQGKVSYQGKTVTNGVINFMPTSGKPFGGPIQSDGTYQCKLPVGSYQVVISAPAPIPDGWKEGDPPPSGKPQIPGKYAVAKTSGLTAEISSDTSVLDFAIEDKK